MKKFLVPALTLACTIFAACNKNEEQAPAVPGNEEEIQSSRIRGVAIIEVTPELAEMLEAANGNNTLHTKSAAMDSAIDELAIESYERVFPDAGEYEERTRREGLNLFYRVRLNDDIPATKAGAALSAVDGITGVEFPRKTRRCSAVPNDPYFKWQWDLYNDKSLNIACTRANSAWGIDTYKNDGTDIGLISVWENYTTGNPDVIVAVMDGGIDLNHPDLAANCIPAGPEGSRNFVDRNYTITPDSHGTHVAGVISAVRNNGIGVAGIAGGDFASGKGGVRLLSCQIFTEEKGASDSETANAIKWGADHGAVISQNSWGYYADENEDGKVSAKELEDYKKGSIPNYLRSAIDYFIKYAGCDNSGNQKADSPMKGGVVIFAAGNEAIDYDVICAYEPVISVSAGTAGHTRAYYSNYGPWVDICAPGGDGLYNNDSVTSFDSEGYSRGQIFNTYATEKQSDYDYTNYGYMSGTSMACPHISGAAALIVSFFGGPGFTNDELTHLLIDGADNLLASGSKYIGPWVNVAASFKLGNVSVTAPEKVSEYSLDAAHRAIEVSYTVPSDVDDGKASGAVCLISKDRNALAYATPENPGQNVSMATISANGAAAGEKVSGTVSELNSATTYYTVLYAYDGSRNFSEVSEIKSATTPEDNAPVLKSQPEGILLYDYGASTLRNLDELFSDPDGDELSYMVSVDNRDAVTPVPNGNILRINARNPGYARITLIASDGEKSCESFIPILVKSSEDPAETYPVQVEDVLNIRTEEGAETYVLIVSSTGKTVYEDNCFVSAFQPLAVDMSSLAPGRYNVTIKYNGKTYYKNIVKK